MISTLSEIKKQQLSVKHSIAVLGIVTQRQSFKFLNCVKNQAFSPLQHFV